MSESGAGKGLLIEEVSTQKMGDLDLSQIHLVSWLGRKVFKGKEGKWETVVGCVISSWTF